MSAVEDYRRWRRLDPAIGCRFARVIAIQPQRYGQVIEVVPPAGTVERMAEQIASRVTDLIANKAVSAAALLFPHLTTLEETARTMLAVGHQPSWTVTPSEIVNEAAGPLIAIRVSREIPFGNSVCPSESLLLGDFDIFPATRRSPITALEIFVGEPLPSDPKTGNPTTMANLAHMVDRDVYGHKPFDNVWADSVEGRKTSLGTEHDNRAKARVTLVMPVPLARRLGCAP